jgi:proteasome assembly chaperone (PAC2) family protein
VIEALHLEAMPDDLREPVLVAAFRGWNDAASGASNALTYLAGQMNATRVGHIDPEEFYDFQVTRPMIDLSTPGEETLTWPEVGFYLARDPGAPRDVVCLTAGEPSLRWRTFCELVLRAAGALGCRTVITLGSLLADVPHTRDVRLTALSSDDDLIDGLGARAPSYRGPTGIVGVLHHMAAERGLLAVSLWAPASHYAAGVSNAKASLALMRGVERVTGVRVDLSGLETASASFERQVTRAVDADPKLREMVDELERAAGEEQSFGPGPLPTGDELAQELERFLRERGDDPG